jgi:hypothetical protein
VVIVSDRPAAASMVAAALGTSTVRTVVISPDTTGAGVDGARRVLDEADRDGDLCGVVTVVARSDAGGTHDDWQSVLAAHTGLRPAIMEDARWARACAEHAATRRRALGLVHLVDAVGAGGRTRSQAAAQLSRASSGATEGLVTAHAIAIETDEIGEDVCALVGMLIHDDRARALSGAELVAGRGWLGLRCHPCPVGSVVFGEPRVPEWFDTVLAEMLR